MTCHSQSTECPIYIIARLCARHGCVGYSTVAIDNALADVEAHCYVVDIRQTDCEQMRSRINNNGCRMF